MAEKLSWSELRRALAKRANVSEKEANTFLTTLNAQIVEALKEDKQVKINGLGTFKLQAVAPRKSVDVTTGEQITIQGYNKMAFIPEAGVKELVEKVETMKNEPSNDPIQKLGAQAEEIKDILGDLGQMPKEAPEAEVEAAPAVEEAEVEAAPVVEEPEAAPAVEDAEPAAPKKRKLLLHKKEAKKEEEPKEESQELKAESQEPAPVEEEPKAEEPAPVVEEPKVEEPAPVVEEPKVEEHTTVVVAPIVEAPAPVAEEPKAEEPKKKKNHFWRDTLIVLIILLILCVVGYFFLRQQICTWVENLVSKIDKIELVNKNAATEEPADSEELVLEAEPVAEEVIADEPVEEIVVAEEPQEEGSGKYKDIRLTENITEGSRLAWISKKYYGHQRYWPYLYDANRDHITNPSVIPVGTPIRVPKLTAAQRDTTSAEFTRLKEEAVAAIR